MKPTEKMKPHRVGGLAKADPAGVTKPSDYRDDAASLNFKARVWALLGNRPLAQEELDKAEGALRQAERQEDWSMRHPTPEVAGKPISAKEYNAIYPLKPQYRSVRDFHTRRAEAEEREEAKRMRNPTITITLGERARGEMTPGMKKKKRGMTLGEAARGVK